MPRGHLIRCDEFVMTGGMQRTATDFSLPAWNASCAYVKPTSVDWREPAVPVSAPRFRHRGLSSGAVDERVAGLNMRNEREGSGKLLRRIDGDRTVARHGNVLRIPSRTTLRFRRGVVGGGALRASGLCSM